QKTTASSAPRLRRPVSPTRRNAHQTWTTRATRSVKKKVLSQLPPSPRPRFPLVSSAASSSTVPCARRDGVRGPTQPPPRGLPA
uniref:Uncharacterized protein n=1 Tax=Aegilops tauschii subsp. strangulata TaxID=200361 RepID=A0A453B8F4_AEGTS